MKQPNPMTEPQLRAFIRERLKEGRSLRAMAALWNVSPSYLSDVIRGKRPVGPKIMSALGIVKRYVKVPRAPQKGTRDT